MNLGCAFLLALSIAIPGLAQTTVKEARDLAAYPLTMEHVTGHYQVLMDLTREEQQNAGLKRELQGWSTLPLDRQIQMYGTNPKVASILKAYGMTARDQVMTQTSLLALMIAVPSIEQKKRPNGKNKFQVDASTGAHVKFYHDHQAEITKLGSELVDVALGKK